MKRDRTRMKTVRSEWLRDRQRNRRERLKRNLRRKRRKGETRSQMTAKKPWVQMMFTRDHRHNMQKKMKSPWAV